MNEAKAIHELLKGCIASRWLIVEREGVHSELGEESSQALVLDTSGKGAAAHHPGVNAHARGPDLACEGGDLAERSELISVRDTHEECVVSRQMSMPVLIRVAPAVQIELVRLVDQLQRPGVRCILAIVDSDRRAGLFQECIS